MYPPIADRAMPNSNSVDNMTITVQCACNRKIICSVVNIGIEIFLKEKILRFVNYKYIVLIWFLCLDMDICFNY